MSALLHLFLEVEYSLLQLAYLTLVAFSLELFLDLCLEHIPLILKAPSLTTRQIVILYLHL